MPRVLLPLLLLTGLLAGCGFQLRGAAPVPTALQPLSVHCDESVPVSLCQAVTRQFREGQVQIRDRDAADYHLQLGQFRQQRRTSAVNPRGEAAEYDLRQRVVVSLISADQVPLLADSEISSSRSYRFDSTNVLANRREQRELESSLHDTLARQILFRMSPFDQPEIDRIRDESRSARQAP